MKIRLFILISLFPSYLFAIDPSGSHAYVNTHNSIGEAGIIILCILLLLIIGGELLIAGFKTKRAKDINYTPVRDAAAKGIGCLVGGSVGIFLFLLKLIFKIFLVMFNMAITVVLFVLIGHLIFPDMPNNMNEGPAGAFVFIGLFASLFVNKYMFKFFERIDF